MPLKQVTKSSDNSLTTFKVRKTDIKCRIRDENTENFYTVSVFFNPPHIDDHHIHP